MNFSTYAHFLIKYIAGIFLIGQSLGLFFSKNLPKHLIMNIAAIILAAGRGTRAGAGLPKTYRLIEGETVLRKTLNVFLSHQQIDNVQVVIHPDDIALYEPAVEGLNLPPAVFGGATRALSVAKGMKAITADYVLIHDGARPFITHELISRVIAGLTEFEGVIPALAQTDALWRVDKNTLIQPVDRAGLVRAQTPQGFRYQSYAPYIEKFPDAKDDAEAAILSGLSMGWVLGSAENSKLTFKEDFDE